MAAVANLSKGQMDMLYKSVPQALIKLTKQRMRHQVCPGETFRSTLSESAICSCPGTEVTVGLHIM